MSNDYRDEPHTAETRTRSRVHTLWYAATALALAGNAYLLFMTHDLAKGLANKRDALSAQIAALDRKTDVYGEESRQRMEFVSSEARQEATAALEIARGENRKSTAKVASTLARRQAEQRQVAGDLNDLKLATETAASRLNEVSGDVSGVKVDMNGVKGDVASTRLELEGAGADLKRVNGDMGVMSGLVATNGKELAALRELGDRNYFEFDVKKAGTPQKVGDIRLTLRKTDPKKNKFTLDVYADDKTMEKRDRTINEPIQLYVAGDRQPYEIVVNAVTKDEVTGYLATPKTRIARR